MPIFFCLSPSLIKKGGRQRLTKFKRKKGHSRVVKGMHALSDTLPKCRIYFAKNKETLPSATMSAQSSNLATSFAPHHVQRRKRIASLPGVQKQKTRRTVKRRTAPQTKSTHRERNVAPWRRLWVVLCWGRNCIPAG